jgi:hypothetical protein
MCAMIEKLAVQICLEDIFYILTGKIFQSHMRDEGSTPSTSTNLGIL